MTAQKNLGDRQRCLLLFIDPFSFSYPLLSFLHPLSSLEQMGGWPCGRARELGPASTAAAERAARHCGSSGGGARAARPGGGSGGGARGLGPVSAAAAESAARPGGGSGGGARRLGQAAAERAGWARLRRRRRNTRARPTLGGRGGARELGQPRDDRYM